MLSMGCYSKFTFCALSDIGQTGPMISMGYGHGRNYGGTMAHDLRILGGVINRPSAPHPMPSRAWSGQAGAGPGGTMAHPPHRVGANVSTPHTFPNQKVPIFRNLA